MVNTIAVRPGLGGGAFRASVTGTCGMAIALALLKQGRHQWCCLLGLLLSCSDDLELIPPLPRSQENAREVPFQRDGTRDGMVSCLQRWSC